MARSRFAPTHRLVLAATAGGALLIAPGMGLASAQAGGLPETTLIGMADDLAVSMMALGKGDGGKGGGGKGNGSGSGKASSGSGGSKGGASRGGGGGGSKGGGSASKGGSGGGKANGNASRGGGNASGGKASGGSGGGKASSGGGSRNPDAGRNSGGTSDGSRGGGSADRPRDGGRPPVVRDSDESRRENPARNDDDARDRTRPPQVRPSDREAQRSGDTGRGNSSRERAAAQRDAEAQREVKARQDADRRREEARRLTERPETDNRPRISDDDRRETQPRTGGPHRSGTDAGKPSGVNRTRDERPRNPVMDHEAARDLAREQEFERNREREERERGLVVQRPGRDRASDSRTPESNDGSRTRDLRLDDADAVRERPHLPGRGDGARRDVGGLFNRPEGVAGGGETADAPREPSSPVFIPRDDGKSTIWGLLRDRGQNVRGDDRKGGGRTDDDGTRIIDIIDRTNAPTSPTLQPSDDRMPVNGWGSNLGAGRDRGPSRDENRARTVNSRAGGATPARSSSSGDPLVDSLNGPSAERLREDFTLNGTLDRSRNRNRGGGGSGGSGGGGGGHSNHGSGHSSHDDRHDRDWDRDRRHHDRWDDRRWNHWNDCDDDWRVWGGYRWYDDCDWLSPVGWSGWSFYGHNDGWSFGVSYGWSNWHRRSWCGPDWRYRWRSYSYCGPRWYSYSSCRPAYWRPSYSFSIGYTSRDSCDTDWYHNYWWLGYDSYRTNYVTVPVYYTVDSSYDSYNQYDYVAADSWYDDSSAGSNDGWSDDYVSLPRSDAYADDVESDGSIIIYGNDNTVNVSDVPDALRADGNAGTGETAGALPTINDGWIMIAEGKLDDARELFTRIGGAFPYEGAPQVGYAITVGLMGNHPAAVLAMRQALRNDPLSLEGLPQDESLMRRIGELADTYRRLAEEQADETDWAFMHASLLHILGDPARAYFLIDKAMDKGEDDSSAKNLKSLAESALAN